MASDLSTCILFLTLLLMKIEATQDECRESRCRRDGPVIRFPFRLRNDKKQLYEDSCAYPGLVMSCTDDHETMLELSGLQVLVRSINYTSQVIRIYDSHNCLSEKLLKLLRSNITPFQFGLPISYAEQFYLERPNITFFNCSSSRLQFLKKKSDPNSSEGMDDVSNYAQDVLSCPIYAAYNGDFDSTPGLIFCTRTLDVTSVFVDSYSSLDNEMNSFLHWKNPDCRKCEIKGMGCKLKNNGSFDEIECFQLSNHKSIPWIPIAAVLGSVISLLVLFAVYRVRQYYMEQAEDQARLEKFLEDYKALKPTRFSYVDIKRITRGFKEKLGEGAHGTVFKGMLSSDILVAVKMLNNSKGDGQEFINEVGIMGKIHHVNVVRLVGYCADGHHRALVYDFYPLGSLQNFISSPDDRSIFLGWGKLHGIALGIARGIEYLHQGCEQRILHFDINPHNVLLDNNYIPKITDFGLAKVCSRDRSTVSVTAAKGTLGYIAPEVFSRNLGNGNVSYKSDVYSYGMLLLEMVGGRNNMEQTAEDVFHVLYPEWIHNLVQGKDSRIHIEGEEHIQIAKRLAVVGLWCIQWHPIDRPSMKVAVQMLEGEDDHLTIPPSPFDKVNKSKGTSATVASRRTQTELQVIEETM